MARERGGRFDKVEDMLKRKWDRGKEVEEVKGFCYLGYVTEKQGTRSNTYTHT